MPTKVEVLLNGEPLVGATVLVGEIGGLEKETDEDGKVALTDIPESYAAYTEVWIQTDSVFASAKVIIKYNEITTVDLGERE